MYSMVRMGKHIVSGMVICFSFYSSCVAMDHNAIVYAARPSLQERVYDYAGIISDKSGLEVHLNALYKLVDIDMVVVTFDSIKNDNIDNISARLLSNWKIGKNTNGLKGLLFVLSVDEQIVRFEVGYDLEGIYPDVFVDYIEKDQMAPFFKLARVQDGISATLEMIIAKAHEEMEKGGYDPDARIAKGNNTYYSGGGGARRQIEIGSIKIPEKSGYPEDIMALFVPQPTPEEAYLLDIEKCKRRIRGYDFDLYTDKTREISKNWVFTNAQMDNEVRDTRGKSFKTFIKDNLAIAVFGPKYSNCPPIFLEKSSKGWQLNYADMSRMITFDMSNHAHIRMKNNPYMDLFKENGYTFGVNGFLYYKGEEPAYLGVSGWSGGTREAEVNTLVDNGPGYKTGLKSGDIIIKVGEINVKSTREITLAEKKYQIGETVIVKVKRNGRIIDLKLTLEAFDPFES